VSAVATRPRPAPPPPKEEEPAQRDSLVVRVAAFAALAGFASAHWVRLVAAPPAGRAVLWVFIATAAALALALLPRLRLPRAAELMLAVAIALAAVVGALAAAGLSARLLAPGHLGELVDGIDRGLAGARTVDWPYDGPDPWVRLTILLGAPLMVVVAAAVGFWPARRPRLGLRWGALLVLLVLYGWAVTERDPGAPALRGLALLVLVAAWLWLPRIALRHAAPAAVLVVAAGACALPVAAKLDADQPWWDYRSWNWFGGGKRVSFDWNHSYGPLQWPRKGTTLLYARSKRGNYWKAETLDRFDGFRWLHSNANSGTRPGAELPASLNTRGRRWDYFEYNPKWDERIRFTVRALSSDFVVGAGTTYAVTGVPTTGTADGTTVKLDEPLERGDTYTVQAYAPDPSPRQMRGAPAGYAGALGQYTTIFLPRSGETARGPVEGDAARSARAPLRPVLVPLRGNPGAGGRDARRRLRASPYASMYRLATRLSSGAPTVYDVVKRIESHLRSTYRYDERVPNHDYPLQAFLTEDRRGYCQQFSGAMALMLRMAGVPARVASGFSAGSYNRDTHEWRIRDLDAHSWVEAYFSGIGWVPFDPTPSATPAESQLFGGGAAGDAGAVRGGHGGGGGAGASDRAGKGAPARGHSGGGAAIPWWTAPLGLALLAGLTAGALFLHARLRRADQATADAPLRELQAALVRLGWRLPPGTTLLALERRLGRVAGPAAAVYAAKLRAYRYGPRPGELPDARERRELRRALVERAGLRARFRAFAALPPGRLRRL
jgi:protein-glutamine gamma-glutamyltransferase